MTSPGLSQEELLPGTKLPTKSIHGEQETSYVRRLERIFRAARLNNYFPDSRSLREHVRVLSPKMHQGLYSELEINTRSGLPSYKEWTRVQTDVRLAPQLLSQLEDPARLRAKATEGSIHEKQLKKHSYYTAIAKTRLAQLGGMQVTLRRVEPAQKTAYFCVVLDKLEASGLFVRYTIDLHQRASVWSKEVLTLDEAEAAQETESFKALIYKFASLDAELTFIKLGQLGGLGVERVVKGTVGPIYWGDLNVAPAPLASLMSAPEHVLAMFSYHLVSLDVAESKNNDPLAPGTSGARAGAAKLGYQVFKDRKFVIHPQQRAALTQWLGERGTKNLVYTVS